METCNACGKPNRDGRFRACEKCREGWRLDKGLSYQKKTVPIEQYKEAIADARAEAFKAGQIAMRERAAGLQEIECSCGQDGCLPVARAKAIRALAIEEPQS